MGIHLGCWMNYQLGMLTGPTSPPPYPIIWPTYDQLSGHTMLRMIVGGVILLATRAIFKPLSYLIACQIVNEDPKVLKSEKNDIENKAKIFAELSTKFVTYAAMGFAMVIICPIVFQVIGIERSTFYTEM